MKILPLLLLLAALPVFAQITGSTTNPQAPAGSTVVDVNAGACPTTVIAGTQSCNTGYSVGTALTDGYSVAFNGVPTGQGVVAGTSGGNYADPIIDSSGDPFVGDYFSTGVASITITFDDPQSGLALLWGSVDTYNTLLMTFSGASGTETVTGAQAAAAAGILPDGDTGFGGSVYLAVTPVPAGSTFTSVTFSSTGNSFEFADLAAANEPFTVAAPEPGALTLLVSMLTAVAGFAGILKKKMA